LEGELLEQMRVGDIRKVWTEARPHYAAGAANRAQREFVRLLDRAYAATDPPVPPSAPAAGPAPSPGSAAQLAAVAGAALVGVAVAVRLRRRRADPS
jgi:hypothetical protein